MYFNIEHGYLLKTDSLDLEERILEYEKTILFKNTPKEQLDKAIELFRKYKQLEKENYVCPSCGMEIPGTQFDIRFGVCYNEECHPSKAWGNRPATLSYSARQFNIECEYCKKEMIFYETQLKVISGDNFQGHNVERECEHCGKINRWQGFV